MRKFKHKSWSAIAYVEYFDEDHIIYHSSSGKIHNLSGSSLPWGSLPQIEKMISDGEAEEITKFLYNVSDIFDNSIDEKWRVL